MIAFGILAIILGVIAFFIYWWLAIIGLVLGIIGICKSGPSRVLGIIGVCFCSVDLLIILITLAVLG